MLQDEDVAEAGDRPRERDLAGSRRLHRRPGNPLDLHAPVLDRHVEGGVVLPAEAVDRLRAAAGAINKARVDHLEIPPLANASMKMNMMGVPGYIGIPQILGVLPGMTPFATALMKSKMKKLGVPPVREYLEMMVDGGAKLYACKMSVDMFDLKKEDFIDGVQDIVTAGDFMDMTEGAQIIFI